MSPTTHSSHIPRLRFPGFFGEWEEKKLGEVGKNKIIKNRDNSINFVLTNSATLGIVSQESFFDKDIANSDNTNGYYIVDIGDFVYNPRISNNAPYGPIKQNKLKKGIMSPLYTIFSIDKGNKDFYTYYFETTNRHKYLHNNGNSGARSDRLNISNKDFYNMPLNSPTFPEQTKIASFLTTVDDKIQSLTDLRTTWADYKTSMMQQIFSQSIRFPGFTDEWEEKKLADLENEKIIELGRGEVISKNDINEYPGDYPIYSSSVQKNGLFGYYGKYLFNEELITRSIDGGGHFFYRPKTKFSITNVSGYLRILKDNILNYQFLKYNLDILHSKMIFNYQDKAHPSVIKKLYILKIPSLPEQEKIANFLSSIDDKISELDAQIQIAKQWKAGLLQGLFI